MEGKVYLEGVPARKAGVIVSTDADIELKGEELPYVSRGGLKIEAALDHFQIDLNDKVAMDVGVSTGGFTDCMLQRGVRKVYAIDVGYGQLDWRLRNDPRVIVLERTNVRYLSGDSIPEEIQIAVIDVSFISLLKVIPKVSEFLAPDGEILALIKPQFEVGREEVEKGGIIRSEEKRLKAVKKVSEWAVSSGFENPGIFESPVRGQKGNIEYFIYLRKPI
jgi:23S rRNA (cytidine1920-2'-O)/16S rRNA (cytidine1409-2'-O)-methyltransferase